MPMMSMQELFYGESEPTYFVHYGRVHSTPPAVSSMSARRTVLSSVKDAVCDPYNQRATIARYPDPAQALPQANRVKNNASSESSYSTHRYYHKVPSHQNPQDLPQQDNSSYAQSEKRITLHPDHYNRSRSGNYFWTSCPCGYKEPAVTHVVSVNTTIATRIEMACN